MVYARIIGIRFFEQTVQYHNVLSTCKNVLIGVTSYVRTILKFTAKLEHAYTCTRLTALFPGLPTLAGARKAKPIWILLKQETVSGSGISWAICKSAPSSRQTTTPAPHHSILYRPDALSAVQPTASKHWRPIEHAYSDYISCSLDNR